MADYYYTTASYPLSVAHAISQPQSQPLYLPHYDPRLSQPHIYEPPDDLGQDNPYEPIIVEEGAHDDDDDEGHNPDERVPASSGRICSLKGCGAVLADDYTFKMCEACRVKHQAYSRVKRNKRRQEKLDAGMSLRQRGPNKPKPPLWRVNGQLAVDPKWEHLDNRLFGPRPVTPPPKPPPPEIDNRPIPKDGYRRKPLPAKDEGAIEFNFVPVKICSIKGCYQPIPFEYDRKTCLDCQDRCKEYSVRKRAKIRQDRVEKGLPTRSRTMNQNAQNQSPDEEMHQDGRHLSEDLLLPTNPMPIDPAIIESEVSHPHHQRDMSATSSPSISHNLPSPGGEHEQTSNHDTPSSPPNSIHPDSDGLPVITATPAALATVPSSF